MSDRVQIDGASIRLDSMPATGRDLAVTPNEDERAALAEAVGVSAVNDLHVQLHAVKFRGGIRVTGRLTAEIVQPSVVSLDPVTQAISEPIDRIFLPGGEKAYAGAAGAEIFVDLEGDDIPDHFEGPEADLSGLIVETLALGIDLYPRAEGETVEAVLSEPDEPPESPFAALKALKDKEG
ncbi:MAG TPA: DUF177 domain-containing protein [Devosia sp.]|nr:DUF177 domain-containing protein [Devosia sp.]